MNKLFSLDLCSVAYMQLFDGYPGPMGSWWWMSIKVHDDLEYYSFDVKGVPCLFKEVICKPIPSHLPPKLLVPSESCPMSFSPTSSPPSKAPLEHGVINDNNQSPPICNSP